MRVRLHSFRARALLACVPAAAMVFMATAGTASAAHTPANTRAEIRTILEHLLSVHPRSHGAHFAVLQGTGLRKGTSSNWSGYADDNTKGNTYVSVAGKWKEPKVTSCATNGPLKAVVFWVGIDGFTSNTVEQGGTFALCGQGQALIHVTWWETFPTNNITVVGTTVKVGDNIAASVVRSGTKYTIKVTDSTTKGNSFSKSASCTTCANSSAEWIAEAPSANGTEVPLPKFSTWTLTNATVKSGSTSGTISKFPDDEITMSDPNTTPKNSVVPGALNSAGNSFKDVWKS
jgi:hypothetical protein